MDTFVISSCVILCTVFETNGVVVDLSSSLLYDIPWDQVPSTVTDLVLDNNRLVTVDYIPVLSALSCISLNANKMVAFPDLSNLTSLVRINLRRNDITEIGFIPQMDRLRIINLMLNQFTEFPLLQNVGGTLAVLILTRNKISSITSTPYLPELKALKLGLNLLTEFPNLANASDSLEELLLGGNMISQVSSTTPLPALQILDLSANRLTAWPDLSQASSALVHLNLSYNSIGYLGPLTLISTLETLDLSGNQLTEFPDLADVSESLSWLGLSANGLTHIQPPALLAQLAALRELHLDDNLLRALVEAGDHPPGLSLVSVYGNPLTQMPNMCKLDTTLVTGNQLVMRVGGAGFPCGPEVVWLKLAADVGSVGWYDAPPVCAQPPALAGVAWADLTVSQIVGRGTDSPAGDVIETRFRRLEDPSGLFCVPPVTRVMRGVRLLACGGLCRRLDACLVFAVDNGDCVLTEYNGAFGSSVDFLQYTEWYVFG